MTWSIVNISNLPPGDDEGNFQYIPSSNVESSDSAIQLSDSTKGLTPALSSFTGRQPWGFAGPTIFTPVIGTPVTDCVGSGCGDGDGGSARPTGGFLYPRRA